MPIPDMLELNKSNTTSLFSQVLCVTDSDETSSEHNRSVIQNLLQNTNNHEIIDLTINDDSEILDTEPNTETNSQKTQRQRIGETEDLFDVNEDSSQFLNISKSTNKNSAKMSSSTMKRLNDFFDKIPEPEEVIQHQNVNDTQSSVDRFLSEVRDRSEEININETQSSSVRSDDSQISDDDTEVPRNTQQSAQISTQKTEDMWKPRINISAKININIQVSQVNSSSESETEAESSRFKTHHGISPTPFIDRDMMSVLTDIYGDSWRTPEMLKYCKTNYAKERLKKREKDISVSFLGSLDDQTPLENCCKDALKYRKKFDLHKDELSEILYNMYNEKVFQNQLTIPLSWNKKLTTTAGRCFNIKKNNERSCRIELSNKILTTAGRLRCTLIHEMCHAAAWIFHMENGHGKCWKKWTRQAMNIFPELPSITVCHRYEIEYKYTYQCVLCKKEYKTHSRSKKTENIRCAYCYGKIELFLNKKNKEGKKVTVPVKPTRGFALFVKDNYKEIRPIVETHADAMKMLGEKFSALNTEQKTQYS
ncbi:germ cell nuclear acidic protein-like isoform X2 [Toxorhynchites rutilus septentrionalis]|uniref:germ cell nuclear acidic protein-like isoform X2 n=1 Tax=Toxorhynchites rutilus septentrionalis TaxID=329112 RepID=UPI00247A034B|nr:germ cell nuclear acidic protein-like isoform X2 [Toxorhynchites rutilus septentrionalis]